MIEILSGVNTALLILSAGYLYFVLRYQYATRDDPKMANLSRFTWSVSLAAMAIFFSSLLFFLYDFEVIYKSNQRDLNLINRTLFIAHLVTACGALEWKGGRYIVPIAIIMGIIVFIVRVFA